MSPICCRVMLFRLKRLELEIMIATRVFGDDIGGAKTTLLFGAAADIIIQIRAGPLVVGARLRAAGGDPGGSRGIK